jgi:hypothetical protein
MEALAPLRPDPNMLAALWEVLDLVSRPIGNSDVSRECDHGLLSSSRCIDALLSPFRVVAPFVDSLEFGWSKKPNSRSSSALRVTGDGVIGVDS